MIVDLTVRLGDILTMLGLFSGGVAVVFMQRADMRILASRIGSVEVSLSEFTTKLNGITDILVAQAKHDQRLTAAEDNIRTLQSETRMIPRAPV